MELFYSRQYIYLVSLSWFIWQNTVVVVTSILAWLIPDVPSVLKEQIRREAYITNEIVLTTELRRAQGINVDKTSSAGKYSQDNSVLVYSTQSVVVGEKRRFDANCIY